MAFEVKFYVLLKTGERYENPGPNDLSSRIWLCRRSTQEPGRLGTGPQVSDRPLYLRLPIPACSLP